jgi:chromosome segregation ATPase
MNQDNYTPAGRIQELLDERADLHQRAEKVEAEATALHKKLDALAENFAQCRKGHDAVVSERDALRQEVERMKAEVRPIELAALHAKEDAVLANEEAARLFTACQSLHRAWRKCRGARKVMQDAINAGYDRTSEVIKERDALRAELAEYQEEEAKAWEQALSEKEALRAEVQRLENALAAEHDVVVRQLDCMAGQLRQRDEYKAECERMRGALEAMERKAGEALHGYVENDGCDHHTDPKRCVWCALARAALAAKGGG